MASANSRNWLWFFLVLGFLAVTAISISWVYNARQQLTREELDRNRALWEKHRPRDYVLEYTKTVAREGKNVTERFTVTVKGGAVRSVVMRQEDTTPPFESELRRDQFDDYDMAGMFDWVERLMEEDAKQNRRSFNRATFDPDDGHLMNYVHRGGTSRVEINMTRFRTLPPS